MNSRQKVIAFGFAAVVAGLTLGTGSARATTETEIDRWKWVDFNGDCRSSCDKSLYDCPCVAISNP